MNRKSLFDLLRRLMGRGFRQSEVDAIDDLLDGVSDPKPDAPDGPAPASDPTPDSTHARRVGTAGIALIKRFEGCARVQPDGRVRAYPDPGTGGAPWTIGWGSTGSGIGPATVWTQTECDARLERDLIRYAAEVARAIGDAPTSQTQFDALVSFHYNTGAIGRATLVRRHKAGDIAAAAREFARWKHAGGRILAGLVRRRAAEARLYLAA